MIYHKSCTPHNFTNLIYFAIIIHTPFLLISQDALYDKRVFVIDNETGYHLNYSITFNKGFL